MTKDSKSVKNHNEDNTKQVSKRNIALVILIIFFLLILAYRLSWSPPETENKFEPRLPTEGIINIHEHILNTSDCIKWLDAMEKCNVSTTVMLGSPKVTFFLNTTPGFERFETNNEVILWLEKKYDCKILAFPTLDPRDPNKLSMFKDLIGQGAVGLKLFAGHTGEIFAGEKKTLYDYIGPLNRPDMYGVYDYCERNRIPIIWHIKLKWDWLFNETKAVLEDFPNLIVDIPHFGVLGADLDRLGWLMDEYPGVYTDISFGGFAKWSLPKVSNNIAVFREFVSKYHDRVMFGTDMVVTNNTRKTVPWIVNLTMGYRNMLEKDKYHVYVPNITGEGFDLNETFNGLGLSDDVLNEIYFENPIRFLKGKPVSTNKMNSTRGSILRSYANNSEYIQLKINHFKQNIIFWNLLVLIPSIKTSMFLKYTS